MSEKIKSLSERHSELVTDQMMAYTEARRQETYRIMAETGLPYEAAYRESERAVGGTAGNNNYVWPFMDD